MSEGNIQCWKQPWRRGSDTDMTTADYFLDGSVATTCANRRRDFFGGQGLLSHKIFAERITPSGWSIK